MTVLRLTPHERVRVVEERPELLAVEVELAPGAPPPAHRHPAQDERFEVLEGRLQVRIAGRVRTLGPGEEVEIRRGEAHTMWTEEGVRARWETRPAGRTLAWFTALDRLQAERPGTPSLLRAAPLLVEFGDVFAPAAVPAWMARPVLRVLSAVSPTRRVDPTRVSARRA